MRLYYRTTIRETGLAVDIFKPTPEDHEFYLIAQRLGVTFLFQCTMHKTIVGGNKSISGIREQSPTKWCKECKTESERLKNCLAVEVSDWNFGAIVSRGTRKPREQHVFPGPIWTHPDEVAYKPKPQPEPKKRRTKPKPA